MPVWIWLIFLVALLVLIGNHVSEGLIRTMFYILAAVVAVALVIKAVGVL